jgi:hypothetical protein
MNSSAVRKRFPKVVKLVRLNEGSVVEEISCLILIGSDVSQDGQDLAPSISFDVSEPSKMPDVRGSCYCNEEAKKVILRFWELYVSIYDTDNRQPLLEAYHDLASMSMMCSYVTQGGHVSQVDQTKK